MANRLLEALQQKGGVPATSGQQNVPQPTTTNRLLLELEKRGGVPARQQVAEEPKKEGVLKTLGKAIVKPFAEIGTSAVNLGESVYDIARGDVQGASEALKKTRNVPFLGETKPAFTGEESTGLAAKKMIGYGAEVGSYLPFGKAVSAVGKGTVGAIKQGLGQSIKQTVKTTAKEGLIGGGLAGFGQPLQEGGTWGQAFKSGAIGAGLGLGMGATLGVGLPVAGSVTKTMIKPVAKLLSVPAKSIRETISPTITGGITKAVRPPKKMVNFQKDLETIIPDLARFSDGVEVKAIEDTLPVIDNAKKSLWAEYKSLLAPNKDATIDGNKIADAMIGAMDKRFISQNPSKVQAIIEQANTYRRKLTLEEAEDFLKSVNNDLQTYYAKNKTGQKIAANDPEKGYVVREAEALRDALYRKLDELTGVDARNIKRRWGALNDLQNMMQEKAVLRSTYAPVSLSEQMGAISGIGDIVKSAANLQFGSALSGVSKMTISSWIKKLNSADYLIERAFKKMKGTIPSQPAQVNPIKVLNKYQPPSQPNVPLLPPARPGTPAGTINLPPATPRIASKEAGVVPSPIGAVAGKDVATGRFKGVFTSGKQTPEQTVAGQKAAGIFNPPVVGKTVESKKVLDEMYKLAPQSKKEIDDLADKIAGKYNGKVAKVSLKTRQSAERKITDELNDDPNKITDLARNAILVERKDIDSVFSELNKLPNLKSIKRVSHEQDALGYSGINAKLETSNGLVSEIQVNTPAIIFAKEPKNIAKAILGDEIYSKLQVKYGEGGKGHLFYEQWRKSGSISARKRIEAISKKYYKRFI